jgi:hypothetical protein
MTCTWLGLGLGLLMAGPLADDAKAKAKDKAPDVGVTYRVPYRNTDTNHALVRVRVNGKGPFNFLIDTGAPLLFISTDTAKKARLKAAEEGFYTDVDRLDFEGGPFLTDVKARIEDPYQLVGMNALGLPGVSIDGILGFSILARFKFTLDPTDDRMTWTRLAFDPENLEVPEDAKERAPDDVKAMNMLGPLMKFAAMILGKRPETRLQPRGWLGVEFDPVEVEGPPKIKAVIEGSPAAEAGLKPGDRVKSVNGRAIEGLKAAREAVAKVEPGDELKLTIVRDEATQEITLTAGEGL